MLRTTHQDRTGSRQAFIQAGDRTILEPTGSLPSEKGYFVGRSAQAMPLFVSGIRMRLLRAVLLAAAVISILCFYAVSAAFRLEDSLTNFSTYIYTSPIYAGATASSFLEVLQVYVPVLTVTPEGVLEITDGSSNGSVRVIEKGLSPCQKTLTVHSFGLSYGKPFVGDYTPPPCSFNRVTWNLTVTAAGRQFDRLGIVYLGDVEVFRTSTAEPNPDGIEWSYLKVCLISYTALDR